MYLFFLSFLTVNAFCQERWRSFQASHLPAPLANNLAVIQVCTMCKMKSGQSYSCYCWLLEWNKRNFFLLHRKQTKQLLLILTLVALKKQQRLLFSLYCLVIFNPLFFPPFFSFLRYCLCTCQMFKLLMDWSPSCCSFSSLVCVSLLFPARLPSVVYTVCACEKSYHVWLFSKFQRNKHLGRMFREILSNDAHP